MATTTQIRNWWDPPCEGPFVKVPLYGDGTVSVDPAIVAAVKALDACLKHYSYETRAADTGAYNCRRITGGTGYSLHAYGIALDLNWLTNPYGPVLHTDMPAAMVAAIKAIRTNSGERVWRWGGDYSGNKDAMHFEVQATPAAIASGIDPASLPHAAPAPTPQPSEDDDMPTIIKCSGKPTRLLAAPTCAVIGTATQAAWTKAGAKTVPYTPGDYDALLKHVSDALGR